MKVLIVDDEIKVGKLILHLTNWNKYDMEIIGVITDGDEALKVILKEKPDVVITDIRMPGLDGLRLVEETQQHGLNVYFVIISGYSQFEYAKQAVRLGVEDYLVKPIRKNDLEAVLQKIYQKQEHSEQVQKESSDLKNRLDQAQSLIRKNLLHTLLSTNAGEIQSVENLRSMYGCSLAEPHYYLILLHLYTNNVHSSTEEVDFALTKIRQVVSKKAALISSEYFCYIQKTDVLFLLNTHKHTNEDFQELFKTVSVNLLGIQEVFPDSKITVSITDGFDDPFVCPKKYSRLQLLQMCRFFPTKQNIYFENLIKSDDIHHSVINTKSQKQIISAIEIVSAELLDKALNELYPLLKTEVESEDPACVSAFFRQLIQIFTYGTDIHYHSSDIPSSDYFMDVIDTIYHLDDLYMRIKDEFCRIIEQYLLRQKETAAKPIRRAKQYIAENFSGSLSLESVSREIGWNPAYFSSMFKKQTGQSFTEYLTELRIENAKNLLLQTNSDISDISWEVGYSDVKYFTRLFKKSTSLTPMEYRKLYQ